MGVLEDIFEDGSEPNLEASLARMAERAAYIWQVLVCSPDVEYEALMPLDWTTTTTGEVCHLIYLLRGQNLAAAVFVRARDAPYVKTYEVGAGYVRPIVREANAAFNRGEVAPKPPPRWRRHLRRMWRRLWRR